LGPPVVLAVQTCSRTFTASLDYTQFPTANHANCRTNLSGNPKINRHSVIVDGDLPTQKLLNRYAKTTKKPKNCKPPRSHDLPNTAYRYGTVLVKAALFIKSPRAAPFKTELPMDTDTNARTPMRPRIIWLRFQLETIDCRSVSATSL